MADLQGRIALVTGAAQGIGRAVSLELARAGATLAVADINETKLALVVAEIEAIGGQAAAFRLDVSNQESVSYTHLDVYKRQGGAYSGWSGSRSRAGWSWGRPRSVPGRESESRSRETGFARFQSPERQSRGQPWRVRRCSVVQEP